MKINLHICLIYVGGAHPTHICSLVVQSLVATKDLVDSDSLLLESLSHLGSSILSLVSPQELSSI